MAAAPPRRHIVLVEPWYGGSHRAWADGLVAASRHRITLVTHEDRFWRWRLRGSAVTLAEELRRTVARAGPPDALVVSGLTDLAALLGLAREAVTGVPVALYLHESQLLHPPSPNGGHDDGPAWTQWRSMAAADRVWCNSAFHRDALVAALPGFVGGAPDRGHGDLVGAVAARTAVLPVGVDVAPLVDAPRPPDDGDERPLIVWNQRWDHDKDPTALFRVLRALARDGVEFRLALAGENRRADPREFDAARTHLGDRVVHTGHLPRPAYRDLLLRSAVTVSTARHEFFGIAAVEAMAAGCVPLLPRRLAYPELVPAAFHEAVLYGGRLYERLAGVLTDLAGARRGVVGLRAAMRAHDWSAVAPRYDAALETLAAGRDGSAQANVSTP